MMKAKCSDMPRFWAKMDMNNKGQPIWMIFDRDRADKCMASMEWSHLMNQYLCRWHDREYWNIDVIEWRQAITRVYMEESN